jgi:pilus assembly protein TadC
VSELADGLVLLALALRSGLPVVEGLHEVASSAAGPVRADLSAVVAALRWGRPAAEAWSFAGPAWLPVARAFQVAEETGAAAADVVADTAARLRELHERELERRAGQAGVLLVLALGLMFLPAFVCTAVVPVILALTRGLAST